MALPLSRQWDGCPLGCWGLQKGRVEVYWLDRLELDKTGIIDWTHIYTVFESVLGVHGDLTI